MKKESAFSESQKAELDEIYDLSPEARRSYTSQPVSDPAQPSGPAEKQTPLLDVSERQKRDNASGASTGASKMPRLEYSTTASSAETEGLQALKLRVSKLVNDFKSQRDNMPGPDVQHVSKAICVLRQYTTDRSHKARDAMLREASIYKVKRMVNVGRGKTQLHRSPLVVAHDLEK